MKPEDRIFPGSFIQDLPFITYNQVVNCAIFLVISDVIHAVKTPVPWQVYNHSVSVREQLFRDEVG